MLSWAAIGLAGSYGALLVGGCGVQAVSHKTPIYFMKLNIARDSEASFGLYLEF